MESHVDKILNSIPQPRNRTELLLKVFHQSRQENEIKLRNEVMCKKCLTPWSLGQFTLKMKSSNHKRKARRKYQIERLQKAGSRKKMKRLQQQNNHVALYKCFCNTRTSVQLFKRDGVGVREEDKSVPVTAVQTNSTEIVKKQKTKRKKTAGLIIPPSMSKAAPQKSTNIQKLSQIFHQQQQLQSKSLTPQSSKLNQFFK